MRHLQQFAGAPDDVRGPRRESIVGTFIGNFLLQHGLAQRLDVGGLDQPHDAELVQLIKMQPGDFVLDAEILRQILRAHAAGDGFGATRT